MFDLWRAEDFIVGVETRLKYGLLNNNNMITAERALELAEKVQKKMAPVKLQELSTEIELAAKTGALKITVDEELSQLVYQELENEGFDVEEIENDDTGKIVATVISWAD